METQKERLNYFKKFDYPKHAYTICELLNT